MASTPKTIEAPPTISPEERRVLIFKAKLAEQAERYDDMVKHMRDVAMQPHELTVEERNLLSVAYKNVIGSRRASWRIIKSIEQKEESKGECNMQSEIQHYLKVIEKELESTSNEILYILGSYLIPKHTAEESIVFYQKMRGDYYRYLAEFAQGQNKTTSSQCALESYEKASEVAKESLAPTHPIRLGLALNFSVFYYEILNQSDKACTLAKSSFDDAIAELDTLNEESYKDSTLIMQLLRDNLTLWVNDTNEVNPPLVTSDELNEAKPEDEAVPL